MKLNPVFANLDYTPRILKPNVEYTVERLTHHTLGGPRRADISVKGTAADMWEFAEYIGCPVTIYDDVGRTVWWGYVHEFKASRKGARLYCRGWWERVSWRYYLNSGTNTVETTTQIAALTATQVAALTTTAIGALTTTQEAGLTTAQLGGLTTSQVTALTTTAVAALTTTQMAGLTTTQIAAFTTTQIGALETSDIAALTDVQVAGFTTTQIGAMTTAQANALFT